MIPTPWGNVRPFLRGMDDRGATRSMVPSGMPTMTLLGTRAMAPGSTTVVTRVTMSNATEPPVAYVGKGSVRSTRWIRIFMPGL